jgi:hypothetical protein
MSSAKAPIRLPAWVPEPACRRINELRKTPLGIQDVGRDLLERLATHETMKTEVWRKLPSEPKGIQGNIIDWAFFAVSIFPSLRRRPFPGTMPQWVEWVEHLKKYPPLPNPEDVSGFALSLSEQIYRLKTETDLYWDRLWEGDRSITPDQVLAMLDQIRLFYLRMDEENRTLLASLPKIKRWNADKAPQQFFSVYLSDRMTQTYGQPLDPVVAALAEVAFNLDQGLSAETVRGRRRIVASTPENSRRKSR